MKNVMLNLLVLMVLTFSITSCQQEGFYDDFDDDFQDEFTDGDFGGQDSDDSEGGFEGDGSTSLLTSYAINGESIDRIKDHNVPSNMLSFQQDYAKHLDMWAYFTQLIPANERVEFTEFVVFHGSGQLLGYVEPINYEDLSKWRLALAIDQAGDLSEVDLREEFAYTAIHEFAHMLTLNDEQVDAGGNENSCAHYFPGEGCSKSNSYINALFELGWEDIYEEFLDLNEDGYEMYQRYPERFVTDYAATNPAEDIAEVFSVFVTQENIPSGNTLADKKVKMMYEYSELVTLRDEIRNNPLLRRIKPGSWVKDGKIKRCRRGCKKHNSKKISK